MHRAHSRWRQVRVILNSDCLLYVILADIFIHLIDGQRLSVLRKSKWHKQWSTVHSDRRTTSSGVLPHRIRTAIVLVSGNIYHMWYRDHKFWSVRLHHPRQPLSCFYLYQTFWSCQEWPKDRTEVWIISIRKHTLHIPVCVYFPTSSVSRSPLSSYSETPVHSIKYTDAV